ncbi:non-ribosomal peptide synthase/polyketide synthase [Pseudoalteromonas sp. MMG013]|uniref:non-ribosomal peptide synthase/polyketide synthase n=1 Tax=Pseudoalteromonas sp. MMG013 TaxID=2822687 RepID=UPI001B387AE2|nr:non-ribosomal peptide synthase/polyketide synthase [Pseudoalteromonas sp. MMG013]MBQ4862211.1 non-ribosomal peptide synthase/polyketide synthase [Pseudoalteromonas sp. MMG013]
MNSLNMTLIDLLKIRAEENGNKTAFIFDNGNERTETSYLELFQKSNTLANTILQKANKGDRVILLYPPGLDFIFAFYACLRAGVVAVPLYTPRTYKNVERVTNVLSNCDAQLILSNQSVEPFLTKYASEERSFEQVLFTDNIEVDTQLSFFEAERDNLAFLQYTSGSTGAPKGVMISHGNIVANLETLVEATGCNRNDVFVNWLPMFHDLGLVNTILLPVYLGAKSVLMPPVKFIQKPSSWFEAITEFGGTICGAPNFAFELCVDKLAHLDLSSIDLSTWEVAFNAAEPIQAQTLVKFYDAFSKYGFKKEAAYPSYGMAEATVFLTGGRVNSQAVTQKFAAKALADNLVVADSIDSEDNVIELVACGQMQSKHELIIVNPDTYEELSAGQVGEIWVRGPSLSRGYWKMDELNSQVFDQETTNTHKKGWYRTGDLGFTHNNELFIAGRLKDLLIIRGQNFYPQDLEWCAQSSHPELQKGGCAAISFSDEHGQEKLTLVAEVSRKAVRNKQYQSMTDAIKQAISSEFELSVENVVLLKPGASLKTSSGKIRRRATKEAYLQGALAIVAEDDVVRAVPEDAHAKQGELSEQILDYITHDVNSAQFNYTHLTELVTQYLKVLLCQLTKRLIKDSELEEAVIALGLESLNSIELTHQIEKDLAVKLSLNDLFSGVSVIEMAQSLSQTLATHNTQSALDQTTQITRFEGSENNALSFGQEALWFMDKLVDQLPVYNLLSVFNITGHLDIKVISECLQMLIERHASLRTRFKESKETVVARLQAPNELPLLTYDFEQLDAQSSQQKEAQLIASEESYQFDLNKESLFRVIIAKKANAQYCVIFNIHHIISDGLSASILFKELSESYNAALKGKQPILTPLSISYNDYARWQKEHLSPQKLTTEREYWQNKLADSQPLLHLPYDHQRPAEQSFKGATEQFVIKPSVYKNVKAIAKAHDATPFMVMLSAYKALLSIYSGSADISVGSAVANRASHQVANLVGYFVNNLVIRTHCESQASFIDLLQTVKGNCLEAIAHQNLPFDSVVEAIKPERSLSYSPLFQVAFSLQRNHAEQLNFIGLQVEEQACDRGVSKYDLSLDIFETQEGAIAKLEYCLELFERDTAQRMIQHFTLLLEKVMSSPEQALSSHNILTGVEITSLTHWNKTATDFPVDMCIHTQIEEQVKLTPNATALVFESQKLTYKALNDSANQLAGYLIEQGIKPDSLVGLCAERSIEMVVALLAILKSGAAYVPLDPDYPAQRLTYILDDAKPEWVLGQLRFEHMFADDSVPFLALDCDTSSEIVSGYPATNPSPGELGLTSRNLAYVIYTSGSTGQPKGVMLEHQALVNRIDWMQHEYELTSSDKVLQKTPFSFDVSVWEFIWPLVSGATLVMANAHGHKDPSYLCDLIVEQGVTTLHFVPSMLAAMLQHPSWKGCSSVRQVFCSGEALSSELVAEFHATHCAALHNLYGPTEAAIDVSYWPAQRDQQVSLVPIGKPINNIQLYVLDKDRNQVPLGLVGELYIAGVGLARGYMNKPELTTERFVKHTFDGNVHTRLYRTGDLVRYCQDGNLAYIGRTDDQVKVRGFRVELGEIEHHLRHLPQVREAAVIAVGSVHDKRLVSYVTSSITSINEVENYKASIKSDLAKLLPDYLVPSEVVLLEALPLTSNGKLNRKALVEITQLPASKRAIKLPCNDTELKLLGIWQRLLDKELISTDESFFDIGGHSLLAMRVVSACSETFSKEVTVREFFQNETIQALAELINTTCTTQYYAIEPVSRAQPLSLSFSQQRLWFIDQLEGGSAQYNMPATIRLSGSLNELALQQSIDAIIQRHEILRTTFKEISGKPIQNIEPHDTLKIARLDISAKPSEARESELKHVIQTEAARAFMLHTDWPIRVSLLKLAKSEHMVLVTMHHIAFDGWSIHLFIKELSALYQSFSTGRESTLPALPIQYADYAQWQRELLASEQTKRQLAYWQERLAGLPLVHNLPLDNPRPATQSFAGQKIYQTIDANLMEQLSQLARDNDASLFMILQSAFSVLLGLWSSQKDIVVGSPIAGRNHQALEGLMGFFVNTLVYRTDLSDNPDFITLLNTNKAHILAGYENQLVPFEMLVDELQPERSLSHSPIFQVSITLQNNEDVALELPELDVEVAEHYSAKSLFDLSLFLKETEQGLDVEWLFATDIFTEQTITRLGESFEALLNSIVANPHIEVESLNYITQADTRQLTQWHTQNTSAFSGTLTIHELFEAQVKQTPDAIAVVFENDGVSYQQLNEKANQLAAYLIEQGVKPDSLVGICAERSLEMIVAIYAILKAGGAYLPLEPTYPAQRIAYILDDAQPKLILGQAAFADKFTPYDTQFFSLDNNECKAKLENHPTHNPILAELEVAANNLAYVIYTSGSTGQPKGVMIEHQALVNRVQWMQREYSLSDEDTVLQKTPFSFDVSVWEFTWPLITGATLVVAKPEGHKDPNYLCDLINEQGVTTLHFVPSMLAAMLQHSTWSLCHSVKQVFCSGEALPAEIVALFHEAHPAQLHNLYGPTEAAIDVSYWHAPRDQALKVVPIGKPISNIQLYILDKSHRQVPLGVVGELHIGGVGLARGYINKPQLTAERFIQHPFNDDKAARLYKTGDLARYRLDGNLEYLGRIDDQVKVRGFRIELGEIEQSLIATEQLSAAVVTLNEKSNGDKQLIAHVCPVRSYLDDAAKRSNKEIVNQWQDVFEQQYTEPEQDYDTESNFVGWNNSYTGEAIPLPQMQEWLDGTVKSIQKLRPKNLLEIGCGTGLLLYRYAQQCDSVTALDISAQALSLVQTGIDARDWSHVKLAQGDALALEQLPKSHFDTVVINSVVQYFPNSQYLEQVIVGALSAIRSGGKIMLGDIRNLDLMLAHHSAVERSMLNKSTSVKTFSSSVQRRLLQEQELLLSPSYFTQLQTRYPQITHVDILVKRGIGDNEMLRYRYDVVLHKGDNSESAIIMPETWYDFTSISELEILLTEQSATCFGVSGVDNHRIVDDVTLSEGLSQWQSTRMIKPVSQPGSLTTHAQQQVEALESLLTYAQQCGYHCGVTWSQEHSTKLDIIFSQDAGALIQARGEYCQTYKANFPQLNEVNKALSAELRNELSKTLPEYMLPDAFIALEHLPLTANGKVDKKALPNINVFDLQKTEYVAPTTPTEHILCEQWQQFLDLEQVGVNDNFFALGGHSLLATRVVSACSAVFGKTISVRALFEYSHIRELALYIDSLASEQATHIVRASRAQPLPLSFAQQRLWFIDQLEGGSAQYNVPAVLKLKGSLNFAALQASLDDIIARHESLRTIFKESDGQPVQVIEPVSQLPITEVDLRTKDEVYASTYLNRFVTEQSQRAFDLSQQWPVRVSLVHLASDEYMLLFTMHHIVSDGWSVSVLIKEFRDLYSAHCQGKTAILPQLKVQYADYAQWQRTHLASEGANAQLDYWLARLEGLPLVHGLPLDRPRSAKQSFAGHKIQQVFSKELLNKLNRLANDHNASLFMVLQSAFAVLLGRWSGESDIVMGSPIAGRTHQDLESLIGFFVNTLVYRTDLTGNPDFLTVLEHNKVNNLEAYDNQLIPFEMLVDELQPERSLSYSPIFQVSITLQNNEDVELVLPDLEVEISDPHDSLTLFDLSLFLKETEEGLAVDWLYATDIFNTDTITRLGQSFEVLLTSITENPNCLVENINYLTPHDTSKLLAWAKQGRVERFESQSIHTVFESQVKQTPHAIAVLCEDTQLTYQQLDDKANQLCNYLTEQGLEPQALVGVFVERSIDMLIAILAVLKSGAAYVPIDPNSPQSRAQYIVEDSEIKLLLTQSKLLEKAEQFNVALVCIDSEETRYLLDKYPSQQPIVAHNNAQSLAYVIYTSGSTGKPKGVGVTHHNVVRLFTNTSSLFNFDDTDTWTLFHSYAFDFSVWEIWGALFNGARLLIVPYWVSRDANQFLKLIEQHNVTVLNQTPSAFKHLLTVTTNDNYAGLNELKYVIFGGEALSQDTVGLWHQGYANTHTQLINMYGITETTVHVTFNPIYANGIQSSDVNVIGKPLPDLSAYVLDKHRQQVHVGAIGELYVGGEGVSAGYINRPDLTSERFINNPFSTRSGARLYKTGDLVRYRNDGNLEYVGRSDDQVKLRGFRVELGEIEHTLAANARLSNAIVTINEKSNGDKQLVAHVCPARSYLDEAARLSNQSIVSQWQDVFEEQYTESENDFDTESNFIGWNNSYTGDAIATPQMREWLDGTVERIQALKPKSLLEIGCGTGLLLYRYAQHCESVTAIDLSTQALSLVKAGVAKKGWSHVELAHGDALAISHLPNSYFDTVVINSVIQYFPNYQYLNQVIESLLPKVCSGGKVMLGDIRNLDLVLAHHTAVEHSFLQTNTTVGTLSNRVQRRLLQEQELLLSPSYFAQLQIHYPEITRIDIQVKRGHGDNEMLRYRYDVTLHIGANESESPVSPQAWYDFTSLAQIKTLLDEQSSTCFGVSGVENYRIQDDVILSEGLSQWQSQRVIKPAAKPGSLTESAQQKVTEFEALLTYAEQCGYYVGLTWSQDERDQLDIIFSRQEGALIQARSAYRQSYEANFPQLNEVNKTLSSELKTDLGNSLPEYMVPDVFIALEQLPLTSNGKVDKKALPILSVDDLQQAEYVAPQTYTEQLLCEQWQHLLELEQVGVNDNFFALGGHSLLATRVVSECNKTFGKAINVRVLFEHSCIKVLAQYIDSLDTQGTIQIAPVSRTQPLALSFAQQRLWFIDQLEGGSAQYNMPSALRLKGELDHLALQKSLDSIVARHESLRTVFVEQTNGAVQVIEPVASIEITKVDLSELACDDQVPKLNEIIAQDAQQAFDLTLQWPLRVSLIRISKREHVLLFTMHHIASDGWSVNVLIKEFMHLYSAYNSAKEATLPTLTIQYADYANWQRSQLQSEQAESQLQYWLTYLEGLPLIHSLPLDKPRPASQSFNGQQINQRINKALSDQLNDLAKDQSASLFMVLQSAFAVLLGRWSGENDIVVGGPIAGRTHQDLEGLIGFFVNTLVYRTDLSGNPDFLTLLQNNKVHILAGYDNQSVPFEMLVDELQPQRSLSHSPIFQVSMTLQNNEQVEFELDHIEVTRLESEQVYAKFDLDLLIYETEHGLDINWIFATDIFTQETITRLSESFETLLTAIVKQPHSCIEQLPIVPNADIEQLSRWNQTEVAYQDDIHLHHLFEAQVARNTQQVALQIGDQQWSYQALNEASNRLAAHIIAQQLPSNATIAIYLDRSFEMVVSVLGILKAGAVYLPIDVGLPTARVKHILADSQAAFVLTKMDYTSALNGVQSQQFIFDHSSDNKLHTYSAENIMTAPLDQPSKDLAYVIYTSGSTGNPKGVMISHQSAVNYLTYACEHYLAEHLIGSIVSSSLSFDATLTSLFAPLAIGKRVRLLPESVDVIDELKSIIVNDAHAWLFKITPAHLDVLSTQIVEQTRHDVEHVFVVGGEQLTQKVLSPWKSRISSNSLYINEYGPTETVVGCSTYSIEKISDVNDLSHNIPIGTPIHNTQLLVLNNSMTMQPIGAIGELFIGGDGLAQGYLNNPQLSAEKFVANPTTIGTCKTLYRTGDLVRYLACGELEYIGRTDEQINLKGFRVEPAEIEAKLNASEYLQQAIVVATGEGNNKRLVSYLVASSGITEDEHTLIEKVRQELSLQVPEYMIPSAFMLLDSIPLTLNGKVDKKRLPSVDVNLQRTQKYVAPTTTMQNCLCGVWQDLLGLKRVGITDNFFAVGGDSILSLQVVSRAKGLGIDITVKQMFEYQTIERLTAHLATEPQQSEPNNAPAQVVSGKLDMLPIQKQYLSGESVAVHHYNQAVLLTPREEISHDMLRSVVEALLEKHDALRLAFSKDEQGQWEAEHLALSTSQVDTICASEMLPSQPEQRAEFIHKRCQHWQESFDLEKGNLIKVVRFYADDIEQLDAQRIFIVVHHLIVDGVSWRVMLRDLEQFYLQLRDNSAINSYTKTASLQQWGMVLNEFAHSDGIEQEKSYWLSQLQDDVPPLPIDSVSKNRPELATSNASPVHLDVEYTDKLLHQCNGAYQTKINDLLLSSVYIGLRNWSGNTKHRITLESHGREMDNTDWDLSETVGWFTSMYPLVLSSPSDDIGHVIKSIKELNRQTQHNGIGYGLLLSHRQDSELLAKAQENAPQLLFNYLGQLDQSVGNASAFQLAKENIGSSISEAKARDQQLALTGKILSGKLLLELDYSEEQYYAATIDALSVSIQTALIDVIDHCVKTEHGGFTPSDFPLVDLSQQQVDKWYDSYPSLQRIYPAAPMQKGLWFHSVMEKGAYTNQIHFELKGHVNKEKFHAAWQKLLDRNDIFRTAFVNEHGELLQLVLKASELSWYEEDWSQLPKAEQQDRFNAYLSQDANKGFDFEAGGLIRLAFFNLGNNRYQVLWSQHHVLTDGWCFPIIFKEVLAAYRALCSGEQQPIELPASYENYIAWLGQQDNEKAREYWHSLLKHIDSPTTLAVKSFEQPDNESSYSKQSLVLDEYETNKLKQLAKTKQTTVNTLVQLAWSYLLHQYNGEDEVVFGATVSGRPAEVKDVDTMLGLFINTIPVKVSFKGIQQVDALIAQLQQEFQQSNQYAYLPLVEIQRLSGVEGENLFNSLIVFENYPMDKSLSSQANAAGFDVESMSVEGKTNYELTLSIGLQETLTVKLGYRPNEYSHKTITQVLGHLRNILIAMMDEACSDIYQCNMLCQAEVTQLQNWSGIASTQPSCETILDKFTQQCYLHAESVAVSCKDTSVTYQELNEWSNQIARLLIEQGVKADTLVGLCVKRSVEIVAGILGVLKAGGAYVPLDPSYPDTRLSYMVEDSNVQIILTEESLSSKFSAFDCELFDIRRTQSRQLLSKYSDSDLLPKEVSVASTDLAYIIYTSGSTGQPKGVAVEHRNLASSTESRLFVYPETPSSFALFSSYAFDSSVAGIFWALVSGSKLVIIDMDEGFDLAKVNGVINSEEISHLLTLPSVYRSMLNAKMPMPASLQRVIVAGEECPPTLVHQHHEQHNSDTCILSNEYGPTEAAVWSSVYNCEQNHSGTSVPIGKAVPHAQLYILNEQMQPSPVGVQGELYIAGQGLAREYLNKPALTNERFIQCQFDGTVPKRLYKTGDYARWMPDGNIDFIGRTDLQVKVNGYRIELPEIEMHIAQLNNTEEVVVAVWNDNNGVDHLVAYISASGVELSEAEHQTKTTQLKAYLKTKLPEFMIPAFIVFLADLPKAANGKVDRKKLPAPNETNRQQEQYTPAENPVEAMLCELWEDILGVERVGRNDNFFSLGGHSLLAATMVNLLQDKLNQIIYVVAVFEAPTVVDLAKYLKKHYGEAIVECGILTMQDISEDRKRASGTLLNNADLESLKLVIPSLEAKQTNDKNKNSPAVFVLSPPRSGSTLLRAMLAGSPELSSPPELELLSFNSLQERKQHFASLKGEFRLEGVIRFLMAINNCSMEEAVSTMGALEAQNMSTKDFYGFLQNSIEGKILVDKTASYALDLETLKRAEDDFEGAKYIHLVRHPYGMINSFKEVKISQLLFPYDHDYSEAELGELVWTLCHQNILKFLEHVSSDRHHLVTFEELVNEPERVTKELCEFLNIEFTPQMLEPTKDAKGKMTDAIHPLSKMLGDVKFHDHKQIDNNVAERWREFITEDFLGEPASEVASRFGYQKIDSDPANSEEIFEIEI